MSKSGRKNPVKKQENPKQDEFSDSEELSGGGGGTTKSSSYTSPPSGSGRREPQEFILVSSNENSRKNEKLKKRIGDIEADLLEVKQELNLEEESSGFISQYAAWRRENSLYIDVILVVVLAVMTWYIGGMYNGNSPVPDRPVPENDGACEKKIQALESRFDREMKDLKHDLNSDISDFRNNEFASISSEFDFIKREYEGLKSNTEHRMNEVQTNMASLTEGNDEFKTKQNQALEDFKTQQAETLEQSKTQLESDQKTFKENLEKSIREEQRRRIQEIEDGIGDKVNEKIDGRLGDIQGGIDGLTNWRKKVETWQQQSEGKMHVLHEQGYDTNTVVMLVVAIIVFIVILVVMIMMRQMNLAVQNAVGRSQAMQGGQDFASKLLKNVQKGCAKEKTVCTLYFNEQSKELCVNLTRTVEPDTKKVKLYHLNSHSDIKTMPRSKVIIVYVEKNQRNIILEDPNQELGDLRRTTVEAARIMGAAVVVVYMHHEESRNLGKEDLYCTNLYSVKKHYVLSELEKEKAVLSVYDSFSDFQQKHLKELISKNV